MSIAALVRRMVEAGANPEAIALAVEAVEAAQAPQAQARAQAAERKRRQRERGTVAGQSRDIDGTVTDETLSLPPSPQTPQPPTHTRECVSTRTRETADFERFWAAYPIKVGKAVTRKAFPRALAKAGDVETLIAAIERQRLWERWQRGFAPNPATWLNQERWNDEEPPSTTPPPGKPHDRANHPKPDPRQDRLQRMLAGAMGAVD